MKIRDLECILTVAEHRSFTKAAKALYISQPSLSAIISRAEEEMGVALFDRSASPIALTYAGEIFIRDADEIMDSLRQLEKRMEEVSDQQTGRINVGFPTERASYMLPLLLPEFKRTHQRTEVSVVTGGSNRLVGMLKEKKLDIVVVSDSVSTEGLVVSELYREELFLVASEEWIGPEHLEPGLDNVVDIKKLGKVPLIVLDNSRAIRSFVENLWRDNGLTPNIVMETTNNSAAFRFASAGMGAAIVPYLTVNMIRGVRHTPIYRLSCCGSFWTILALQREDAFVSQMEKDFILTMRQIFNKQPEFPAIISK